MKIDASNSIVINDILIGDVWLCSGQSNMAMTVAGTTAYYQNDVNNSTNEFIRNYNVPREYEFNTPRTDLSGGSWTKTNPTTVLQYSATAYFFAKALYEKYQIPIGLIHSSYGGTPIHAWMSENALRYFPDEIAEIQLLKNPSYVAGIEQQDLDDENNWNTTLKNNDAGIINNWKSNSTSTTSWTDITVPFTPKKNLGSVWYKKNIVVSSQTAANVSELQLGTLIEADSTYVNGVLVGHTNNEWAARKYSIPANTFVTGTNTITIRIVNNSLNGGMNGTSYQLIGNNETINLAGTWKYKIGYVMSALPAPVNLRWKPTALYNSMIASLKNYAMKGAIWYQGEGNTGNPTEYAIYLKSMIEDWRALFNNPTMPFVYVQLPNYQAADPNPSESNWALLRESQLKTLSVPFTGMATTIDVGEWYNLHPLNKKPVGTRLALAAQRAAYYDQYVVSSGPIVESMKIVNNTIEIPFATLGSQLKFMSTGSATTHSNFAIAGSNKVFSWAQAQIVGNKVIVWNDAIPNPVAVRYAWANDPAGTKLFNTENLPASPFRNDNITSSSSAPTTVWTGVANNDFFNEANWKNSVTNAVPASGTINPGQNITLALEINIPATITATGGAIQFSTGSLVLGSANLSATALSGGTVTINEGGYLNLSSASPLLNNVQLNFTSGIGWVRTNNYKASAISATNLAQIKVNNSDSAYQLNLRLDNYYLNGCVVRANLATTTPLKVYDGVNSLGNSALITVNTIHSGIAIAGSMNNKIKSFVLKKGFMVTFAIENDGTGKSINYIASESDLVINTLPKTMLNAVSFIRVIPWNWVGKRGRTDEALGLDTSWIYRWNNSFNSTLDWEYAPMAWGHSGANDAADIATYIGKYNSTHVMGFNEPDNCSGQSGQYGQLCQTDVAVGYYKNLMKTGMRLVSPGCREEGALANGWLKEFRDKATAQDIRIDAIAVHWYDWGSNPVANPNQTAEQIFARFQNYLTTVHNLHGLPIWITEFNANPARSNATNAAFMALALPYLETLDYVERYAWFPYETGTNYYELTPDPENPGEFIDTTTLTAVGTAYKNQVSTPAIPETTTTGNTNVNLENCVCD
jgi:sialate O-acetylesterase